MAQLAARLGRHFDARKWAQIGSVPIPRAARDEPEPAPPPPSTTLADLLPDIALATNATAAEPARPALPTPRFSDDAEPAGLRFVQENGSIVGRLIPPVSASGGVGLIDIDNDGWLDVYAVQGGPFPPATGR